MKTFREVDQELYDHERSLYKYAAQGSGSDPMQDSEWVQRRADLQEMWNSLHPDQEYWKRAKEKTDIVECKRRIVFYVAMAILGAVVVSVSTVLFLF